MLSSKWLRLSHCPFWKKPIVQQRATQALVPTKTLAPIFRPPARQFFGLVPINQYDVPLTNKLKISYALWHHWEIIPLFLVTVFDLIFVLAGACVSALGNKVDIQWTKNWNCISRHMDLRNPTVHKHFTFFQTYEPWPEMQLVLDKMKAAEHRAWSRAASCSNP